MIIFPSKPTAGGASSTGLRGLEAGMA